MHRKMRWSTLLYFSWLGNMITSRRVAYTITYFSHKTRIANPPLSSEVYCGVRASLLAGNLWKCWQDQDKPPVNPPVKISLTTADHTTPPVRVRGLVMHFSHLILTQQLNRTTETGVTNTHYNLTEVEKLTYLIEAHFLTDRADAIGAWGGVSVGVHTHTGFLKNISHDYKYICKLLLSLSHFTIRRGETEGERETESRWGMREPVVRFQMIRTPGLPSAWPLLSAGNQHRLTVCVQLHEHHAP